MKLKGSDRGASAPLPSFVRYTAVGAALVMLATPAQAAFHLWEIREIYSNASGNLQYIEMFCPASGQTFLTGQQITASSAFTLSHGISGDSLNRALLFGTAGIQAAGGPAPDYIIPNGFLSTPNGNISFFGANPGSYTALPTDGVQSRNFLTGANISVNNPQNFNGTVGQVVVPEPATWAIFGLGAIGSWFLLRRRAAA